MFCPNCGKENGEGFRFCSECGFDMAAMSAGEQGGVAAGAQPGMAAGAVNAGAQSGAAAGAANTGAATITYTQGQTEQFQRALHEAEEKLVKSADKTNVLAWIAKILLVAFPGFMLYRSLQGSIDIVALIVMPLIGVLPFYVYVYFARGWLEIAKRKLVKEYFNSLSNRSFAEMTDMLNTSACPLVKDVKYNPYGDTINVSLTGGKELEIKRDENGTPVVEWLRGSADEMVQETLVAYLAKQINTNLKIDRRKVYKNNRFWKRGEFISGLAIFGPMAVAMVVMLLNTQGQMYIDGVKSHVLEGYEYSYERAFNKVFEDGKWSYFEADDGDKTKVVEYAGKANGMKIRMQWIVDPQGDGSFYYKLYAMAIDDEFLSPYEQMLLIETIYECAENDAQLVLP